MRFATVLKWAEFIQKKCLNTSTQLLWHTEFLLKFSDFRFNYSGRAQATHIQPNARIQTRTRHTYIAASQCTLYQMYTN